MFIISYDIASKSLAMSIIYFNNEWRDDLQKINTEFHNEKQTCDTSVDLCKCVLKYIDKLEALVDGLIKPIILDVVDLIPGKKLKETSVILRASRLASYLKYVDFLIDTHIGYGNKHKVLLEYQMGPNDQSRNVGSQILLHYATVDTGFKCVHGVASKICDFKGSDDSQNLSATVASKICDFKGSDDSQNLSATVASKICDFKGSDDSQNLSATVADMNAFNDKLIELEHENQLDRYDVEIVGPSLKNKINLVKEQPHSFFIQKYTKSYDANKGHSKANFLYWIKTKKAELMIKNIKKKNLDDIADSVNMTLAWIHLKSGLI
jgi:hypothetical protein